MSRVVLLAFLASGASGLIFQISWVRQLGHVFGNTTQSAAVVTGVFVLGLGLGAELAGRFADRLWHRPGAVLLRAYAALEIFIGAWGLLLAALLPALANSPFPPSEYVVDARGWHHGSPLTYALQVVVAALLVAPPALAMGATLVVLLRAALRFSVERAASSTGTLYAINTAGASIGALLVDTTLVPALGISGTQACAAGLNLFAAWLALRVREPLVDVPAAPQSPTREPAPERYRALLFAVFLAGVTGMALEIVWFRYLSSLLGAHRATFSLILAVILIGIWIGSAVFGALAQRTGRPLLLFLLAEAALVVTAVIGALLPVTHAEGDGLRHLLLPVLVLVGVPSLCLGIAFPLANAALQQRLHHVGRLAGRLYLSNAVGGLLGSLLAGFLLLPLVGMQGAMLVVIITGVVTLALLMPGAWRESGATGGPLTSSRRARQLAVAGLVTSLAGISAFATLPAQTLLKRVYSREDVRDHAILYAEGLTESIAITERKDLGEVPERILYVDGDLMSGTLAGPQRYMRAMAHVPLLQMAAPRRALVICFGVGNTAHAVSLHPSIETLDIADLSHQILEHGHLFERWNGGVLEDPRTRVFVHDGRQHLRMQEPDSYDLITLEPPPIAQAGVGSLYAREFYALGKSRLVDGGFLTQWLPAYQVRSEAGLSMVRAFLDEFPNAVLLSGFERHLLLVGRKGADNHIDPAELRRRLEERPEVRADLERVWLGSPRALLGTFAADAATLRAATEGVPPASDDWPVSEYSVGLVAREGTLLPKALFDVSTLPSWCPPCVDGTGAVTVEGLGQQLTFLGAWYESEHFRSARGAPGGAPMQWRIADPDGSVRRVVSSDPYLSSLLSGEAGAR